MNPFISSLLMLLLSSVIYAAPDPLVTLQVDALGTPYMVPFKVYATFSEPVTGFGKSAVNVDNAIVTSVSGSKTQYVINFSAKTPGTINIIIPANVVRSLSTGTVNRASNKLVMTALNPISNPSSNFDLSQWILSLPLPLGSIDGSVSISNSTLVGYPSLNTGYSNPPYFFTDLTTGSMNFFAPLHGATTPGSLHPRSGLMEQVQLPGLNTYWLLSSFETNVLGASLLVSQVPPSKRMVIGAIRDKGTTDASGQPVAKKPLVKIFYDLNALDPNGRSCNGCLYVQVRAIPAQNLYLKTVTLLRNAPLNKLFQYRIKLLRDGTLSIKINDATVVYKLNTSPDNTVGWGSQEMFFTAGVNIFDSGTSNSQGGAANFFSLTVKHTGCPINEYKHSN